MLSALANGYAQDNNIISGHFIVQFYPGKGINNLFPAGDEARPIVIKKLSQSINIWALSYNMDLVASQAQLNALRKNPAVALAQFEHKISKREKRTPNDSLFGQQWNMNNTVSSFDVRALQAWGITTGGVTNQGDTLVIAVVDEGFDLMHPDLNYWTNANEIPNNGIDDDGNGYIDDYNGWNATDTSGDLSSSIRDHGTHVAGIAGARGNNKIGVAGVNWNVKILPIIHDDNESSIIGSYAYIYTLRNTYNNSGGTKGAFIVSSNSSFGEDNAFPSDHPIWCMMYDSMGHVGVLNTAATANNKVNVDDVGDMPTTCGSNYLITVTDMSRYAQLEAGYGAISIDLGAPGEGILSTYPGSYGNNSGTSMACPHVAGAVALIYSHPCTKFIRNAISKPGETALFVRDIILNNVEACSALDGKTSTGGTLNLYKCLLATDSITCIQKVDSVNKFQILSLFPNPVIAGNLHIRYSTQKQETVELYITNLLGQAINHFTLPESSVQITQVDIPFYGLASGLYFLNIQSKHESSTYTVLVNGYR